MVDKAFKNNYKLHSQTGSVNKNIEKIKELKTNTEPKIRDLLKKAFSDLPEYEIVWRL
jgi:hypothetical protein